MTLGQASPAPSPCRRGPSLSAEAGGGNEDGCSLRLPSTFFFFPWGTEKESNIRCPIFAPQVVRGPAATRPRYVNRLASPDRLLRSEAAGPRRPRRAGRGRTRLGPQRIALLSFLRSSLVHLLLFPRPRRRQMKPDVRPAAGQILCSGQKAFDGEFEIPAFK